MFLSVWREVNCVATLSIIVSDYFKNLLKPQFSEAGTRARTREEAGYIHFVDYLDELEGIM